MGNTIGRLTPCLCPATGCAGDISHRHDFPCMITNPFDDDGLGHSFCYIRPDYFDSVCSSGRAWARAYTTPFYRTISGASISANTSTPLSTALYLDPYPPVMDRASSFESSSSFASVPLQPIPRGHIVNSGPLPARNSRSILGSGPIERGFLSGPIERGFTSGPIDHRTLQDKVNSKSKNKFNKWSYIKEIKETIFGSIWGPTSVKQCDSEWENSNHNNHESVGKSSSVFSGYVSGSLYDEIDGSGSDGPNLQWAQGKAGEDRVHIVVSEDQGWVFVGIYDGFNGPDAPDFLLSNLYSAVHDELKGLMHVWNARSEETEESSTSQEVDINQCLKRFSGVDSTCSSLVNKQNLALDEKLREKINQMGTKWSNKVRHSEVMKALSEALRKTEEAYLDISDKMVKENPELCLMGSCVLAMLLMGEDIYLMNVGDSRAVLGQKSVDLDFIDEFPNISSLQLTMDHNTYVKEEVKRIRNKHVDDPSAVVNHRVKGSLKVTRAFGAGFLKQPKWNEALLESFRIDYVGNLPYITCRPSLSHHTVGPRDRFLILSSDGLYQYFTNDEAVSEVEQFMASTSEGDPAQHLIEEVLFRAAKRAGMDFHELLEIPQGERRRYHDDVSVIVISLEGTIWRSSM